jgi:hypothetical protein
MKTHAFTVNLPDDTEFTYYDGVQYNSEGVVEDIEYICQQYPDWTSITITIVRGHT